MSDEGFAHSPELWAPCAPPAYVAGTSVCVNFNDLEDP